MAGRKSGKSSRAAAAPSRSSTPARTSAPSQATTTHQSQAVAPATAAPSPVTVHHTSGGGGFLSGVAQMAAGHVAGRVAYDTFFGGSKEAAPAVEAPVSSFNQATPQGTSPMCEPFLKQFMRCLDANMNESSACQTYLDQLRTCRGEPATQSFAGGY